MSSEFNPYREWLGIPVGEQPANYYRLLGLALFESDPNVIDKAADRQMSFIRTFQTGKNAAQSQQLLNELAIARITLLDKEKKRKYDAKLRADQRSSSNGGIGVVSSLGSYGEVQSTPPPSAASLTPQHWSNHPPISNISVQSHVTPLDENLHVPPIPSPSNRLDLVLNFLKNNWIVILISLVSLQFLICGGALLAYLLKPSSVEITQNPMAQPTPKAGISDTQVEVPTLDAVRLAKQHYNQSVELQEKEDYNEALNKINVAVALQPDNEQYKAQQQALTLLIKSLGRAKNNSVLPPSVKSDNLSEMETSDKAKDYRHFDSGKNAGDRTVVVFNGVEFAFRWCPAGTFMMGVIQSEELQIAQNKLLPITEDGASYVVELETQPCSIFDELNDEDVVEKSQLRVTITKGFWIMETEITQKQWRAVMGNIPDCRFKGEDLPVEHVSWYDCQEFCKKCADLGFSVQLPTEAQWEYACRAGTTGEYAGNMDEIAWYRSNSGRMSHPVGTKIPNAWGIYDMHGNVWEWCLDCKANYPSESTDPIYPSNGKYRYRRGGSWDCEAQFCRSAYSCDSYPDSREYYLGFRCVISNDWESLRTDKNKSIDNIENYTPDPVLSSKGQDTDQNKKIDLQNSTSVNKTAEVHIESLKKQDSQSSTPLDNKSELVPPVVNVINGVEFSFRYCPPGTFMMGSPKSERVRELDEIQHKVTLTKGFWIMDTEVTQKQWKAIMDNNPSNFIGDDRPVEMVSWNDCQEFCRKCAKLGFPVQLPTEAQWEYACRAGTTSPYADNIDEIMWYKDNSNAETHPVRTKKPNAWGLYDMHGNVYEWCQDWYDDYPNGDLTNPTGPLNSSYRVKRGGGWSLAAQYCRSASRDSLKPKECQSRVGFRVVKCQESLFVDTLTQKEIDIEDNQENSFTGTWSQPTIKPISVTHSGAIGSLDVICRNAGSTRDVQSYKRFRNSLQLNYSIECQLVQISCNGNKTVSKYQIATVGTHALCNFDIIPQTITCLVKLRFVNKANPEIIFETQGTVKNIESKKKYTVYFDLTPNDIEMLLKQ